MAKKKKAKPERVEQQAPIGLALILADVILSEPATGKFYINGTFSLIFSATFPCVYPKISVYFALTNGHGQTPVKIRLIDANEARPALVEVALVVNFIDPLAVVESVGAMQNVIFPVPGDYRLELYAADTPIMTRRLLVVPPPTAPQNPREGE